MELVGAFVGKAGAHIKAFQQEHPLVRATIETEFVKLVSEGKSDPEGKTLSHSGVASRTGVRA